MKFLADEQLPESLVKWLETQGFGAVHATSLGTGVRISDTDIAKTSVRESRVVISKDIDFFKRYTLLKEPYKLLYLTTGNIKNADLLQLFERNWQTIQSLLTSHDVIEMNQTSILIRF